jgi:tRNA(His) 5'-end guanylyltransferase
MHRPFDMRLTDSMIATTKVLVEKTHACMGYTQSDEISLCWVKGAKLPFPRKHKMTSVLASLAASAFMNSVRNYWHLSDEPFKVMDKLPHFDCRVFSMPSKTEVANMFLWRAMDARKNAIIMVAQSMFSHNQLQGKTQVDMLEMIQKKNKEPFDHTYIDRYKHGTWVRRVSKSVVLSESLRLKIPEAHRPVAGQTVIRTEVQEIAMPIFNKVQNRVEVIFEGQEPI